MYEVRKISLNSKAMSLIGFAIKSHSAVFGFEAVRRSIRKNKLAFVIVTVGIANNSLRKVESLARKHRIPLYVAQVNTDWQGKLGLSGYKIIGLYRGGLAKGFIQNLMQENQCLSQ